MSNDDYLATLSESELKELAESIEIDYWYDLYKSECVNY